MKILEKGDGLNKAKVWLDNQGFRHTTCCICDSHNKTTEICKRHSWDTKENADPIGDIKAALKIQPVTWLYCNCPEENNIINLLRSADLSIVKWYRKEFDCPIHGSFIIKIMKKSIEKGD